MRMEMNEENPDQEDNNQNICFTKFCELFEQ